MIVRSLLALHVDRLIIWLNCNCAGFHHHQRRRNLHIIWCNIAFFIVHRTFARINANTNTNNANWSTAPMSMSCILMNSRQWQCVYVYLHSFSIFLDFCFVSIGKKRGDWSYACADTEQQLLENSNTFGKLQHSSQHQQLQKKKKKKTREVLKTIHAGFLVCVRCFFGANCIIIRFDYRLEASLFHRNTYSRDLKAKNERKMVNITGF